MVLHTASGRGMHGDAVLLELRSLPRLPDVIGSARAALSETWMVHFWHGPENHAGVRSSLQLAPAIASGMLKLRSLLEMLVASKALTLHKGTVPNLNKMARPIDLFLRSLDFFMAPSLTHQWLLLFQVDVAMCPNPTFPLAHFTEQTYIGAPWGANENGRYASWCWNLEECVGNTGFSLWHRETMVTALSLPWEQQIDAVVRYIEQPSSASTSTDLSHKAKYYPKRGHKCILYGTRAMSARRSGFRHFNLTQFRALFLSSGADVWVSTLLQALWHFRQIPMPARFSVETSYTGGYTPVGVHKAYLYLPPEKLAELMDRCPPLRSQMQDIADASEQAQQTKPQSPIQKFVASMLTNGNASTPYRQKAAHEHCNEADHRISSALWKKLFDGVSGCPVALCEQGAGARFGNASCHCKREGKALLKGSSSKVVRGAKAPEVALPTSSGFHARHQAQRNGHGGGFRSMSQQEDSHGPDVREP